MVMELGVILIFIILMEDLVLKNLHVRLKKLVSVKSFLNKNYIGSFVIHKQRPRDSLAYIHSKPVNYINNGGGRDTYISDSAGGLKTIY